jgi:wyosine [tRNA(Phe)-imidazoG37] synthetase (radical SAM superfamily)
MKKNGDYLDSITFAGNGEPTMHPQFAQIMADTVETRNMLYPEARVTVLSNATLTDNEEIFTALQKADMNVMKLDSGIEETIRYINCPRGDFSIQKLIYALQRFRGKVIIQTLFFRGKYKDRIIDNTTEAEINAWLEVIRQIRPEGVMIYSIARDTAVEGLERINANQLNSIALRLEQTGIDVQVTP